jgi:general secretion pathway protein G
MNPEDRIQDVSPAPRDAYGRREVAFRAQRGHGDNVVTRLRANVPLTRETGVRSQESKARQPILDSGFWILNSVPRAFTLVEMMAVIALIVVLVGLVIGAAKYAETKAARSRAEVEIATMEAALESYKADNGIYPNTALPRGNVGNSANLVASLVGGSKKYYGFKLGQTQVVAAVVCFIDPFGRPYNYYCTTPPVAGDQENKSTFDLWSYGPDGQDNTADDITNWKQ